MMVLMVATELMFWWCSQWERGSCNNDSSGDSNNGETGGGNDNSSAMKSVNGNKGVYSMVVTVAMMIIGVRNVYKRRRQD